MTKIVVLLSFFSSLKSINNDGNNITTITTTNRFTNDNGTKIEEQEKGTKE